MDMNILKYMAFIQTVEHGSSTKAGEMLNYSQSGISRMIHDLEKEWKVVLLERNICSTVPFERKVLPVKFCLRCSYSDQKGRFHNVVAGKTDDSVDKKRFGVEKGYNEANTKTGRWIIANGREEERLEKDDSYYEIIVKANKGYAISVDTFNWFYDYVIGSIKYGWISGYPDGTFRPNSPITRAEVTTIANHMLGRTADKKFVDRDQDEMRAFGDLDKDHWAYYQIMEPTNSHDYETSDGVETWTDEHSKRSFPQVAWERETQYQSITKT